MAMKLSEFGKKVSRNLRNPPFVILQTILGMLPIEFVALSQFIWCNFVIRPGNEAFLLDAVDTSARRDLRMPMRWVRSIMKLPVASYGVFGEGE